MLHVLESFCKPLTLNVTVPVNPPEEVTVTVYMVWPPRLRVCAEGVAEREKSGDGEGAGVVTVILIALDVVVAPALSMALAVKV